MDFPPDWRRGIPESDRRGHREEGRTIAIHSLAVLPAYQRMGLGRTIMKSYMQRLETAGIADRIALLAHGHLIEYYESLGIVNKGKSTAQFGGGGWNSMVMSEQLLWYPQPLIMIRSTSSVTQATIPEHKGQALEGVSIRSSIICS